MTTVMAIVMSGAVTRAARVGASVSVNPSSPVGSRVAVTARSWAPTLPPTYHCRTDWIAPVMDPTTALNPNMTRGFARMARKAPSRISPRPSGRSGMMPGRAAGGAKP